MAAKTPQIHELLERDPRTSPLANKGQARIGDAPDEAREGALRAELETFVCDGRFADGLQRILERFLSDLGGSRQEAAWVSGFFGSGKSHLLKMLTHLWMNTAFDDGAKARSLVPGGLPKDIQANFTELDTRARRAGKPLFAAAGTLLSGNEQVRVAALSILLKARGLPTGIPQAGFCFWLEEQGLLERVRAGVESRGKSWAKELNNLHVSTRIAEALLEASPDFASGAKQARTAINAQFPPRSGDLTTEQFVALARKALCFGSKDETLPLTALVLDEAQQYIGGSDERSAVFTEMAEALQTQFDGRVALVASGQSALSATPALQKLRDRFRIQVELTDADVEKVTREVLLRKKPSAGPAIERMFADREGEVSRHLRDTRLATQPGDGATRQTDYPLLSTRRRFWEACLRAAEAGEGVHSQLRSQLRILHDSLAAVAERPLGAVIPTSDLFHAVSADLVSSGVLLNEIFTRITKLDDGTDAGTLRRDLAALVFLIGKLPRNPGVDTGVRADVATLADLLVTDLNADSGPLRQQAAAALDALADEGVLMKVENEYRIQTTEGAEWDREFRVHEGRCRNNEADIAAERDDLFRAAVQQALGKVRVPHGDSKERRSLVLHLAAEAPSGGDANAVFVWLRDGWQCSDRDFARQARSGGTDDPTLHVHIPRRDADDLKARIATALAAQRVLDLRGNPASREGHEARNSMKSRLAAAEKGRDGIVDNLLRHTQVLQGGGSEVYGADLAAKIASGARSSLARLFPRFDEGDHAHWGTAVKRARERSDRPFAPVNWDRDTADHPVAKEVMNTVGAGARGPEVHRKLRSAPFGWPQDAIDAALISLFHAGRLKAERNGQPVQPGKLDQAAVKTTNFRPEQVVLKTAEKIALRGLFQTAGVSVASGEEERGAADFLATLQFLAAAAGGEPPLPAPPVSALLDGLGRKTGNEQLAAVHENLEELRQLWPEWSALAERIRPRREQWDRTMRLRNRAAGLPVMEEVGPELETILVRRSLLAESNPVAPLAAKLADALRRELTRLHRALSDAIGRADGTLAADPAWPALDSARQEEIRRRYGLVAPAPLDIATDETLLRTLDDRPLAVWRAETDAVPKRTADALAAARGATAPTTADDTANTPEGETPPAPPNDPQPDTRAPAAVTLRRATLADEAAVEDWLKETEVVLLERVRKGPILVG